ncbi:hypothetical protein HLH33_10010 [Gluconacetobacter diazotrophicus]|uniref:TraW n=1 Tax=Gluconacetobacter diazotrophicus TaxID=33996 RepID=A0A7W4FF93_GLUDI|nr:hypothetical protein [Gluconacetobacter diazotrophicus]MBB2156639.1 hypothetical protein [Gluconacetobacter diazotrophicus]
MRHFSARLRDIIIMGLFACVLLFGTPRPAYALFDSVPIVHAIIEAQTVLNGSITAVQNVVNTMLGQINGVLGQGFAQLTNYMKAQIGAQQKIADANNMVNAQLAREVRNAQLLDQHAVNRQDCLNLESGQATIIAAHNSGEVATALDKAKDGRARAEKGTPSWVGGGQAEQAINKHHEARYCDDAEVEAGLCTQDVADAADADQAADSLLEPPVYRSQADIDQANDYTVSLIQPVAPAALRGSALTSAEGLASLPGRRGYNAAISLAQNIADDVESTHAGTITLTAAQQAEATREGITDTSIGSLYEATELEVNRKYSSTDWQADLQAMPGSKSVLIQIALLDAQRNWILWQDYKLEQKRALAEATQLSIAAEHRLGGISPMPVPNSTLP